MIQTVFHWDWRRSVWPVEIDCILPYFMYIYRIVYGSVKVCTPIIVICCKRFFYITSALLSNCIPVTLWTPDDSLHLYCFITLFTITSWLLEDFKTPSINLHYRCFRCQLVFVLRAYWSKFFENYGLTQNYQFKRTTHKFLINYTRFNICGVKNMYVYKQM